MNSLAAGRDAIVRYAKLAPSQPGVYRMIDARGDVLYVGKAKNVRNRVRAYARPAGLDTRIERMIAATRALEFVVTRTETEALLLEANLIKRLRPRFNVTAARRQVVPLYPHHVRSLGPADPQASRRAHAAGPLFRTVRFGLGGQPHHQRAAARVSACARAAIRSSRAARGPACCIRSSAVRRRAPTRSTFSRIRRAGARGERVPVRPQQSGQGRACRRDGEGVAGARFRTRRSLPRPPGGAFGHSGAPRRQSARRRGSGCFCAPPAGRFCLRRSVLLPHRPELGQPRLFPEGRPIDLARRDSRSVPRPVLRRQAVSAADPDLARHRGPRIAGGSARAPRAATRSRSWCRGAARKRI